MKKKSSEFRPALFFIIGAVLQMILILLLFPGLHDFYNSKIWSPRALACTVGYWFLLFYFTQNKTALIIFSDTVMVWFGMTAAIITAVIGVSSSFDAGVAIGLKTLLQGGLMLLALYLLKTVIPLQKT